jgi:hypothetical protein
LLAKTPAEMVKVYRDFERLKDEISRYENKEKEEVSKWGGW